MITKGFQDGFANLEGFDTMPKPIDWNRSPKTVKSPINISRETDAIILEVGRQVGFKHYGACLNWIVQQWNEYQTWRMEEKEEILKRMYRAKWKPIDLE